MDISLWCITFVKCDSPKFYAIFIRHDNVQIISQNVWRVKKLSSSNLTLCMFLLSF